jgi:dimethylargininase
MLVALTRAVSPSLAECELTHRSREPIDIARATAQHAAYERLLESFGAKVVRAEPAPELPDAVFIEDIAIVLDEVAVMTRPGAASRRPESADVASLLGNYRPLRRMLPPATLDGGDVLRLGRTLYVGRSARTNAAGIAEFGMLVGDFGYRVVSVDVGRCLHLKSAVTEIADGLLLINPEWVSPAAFPGWQSLPIDPAEPHAANALRIGGHVVVSREFTATSERLAQNGIAVAACDCRELAKAEGAVTCCSLLFEVGSAGH